MRRGWIMLILALAMLAAPFVYAAAEEGAEPEKEWTVMLYLCGSDLESKYAFASGNLAEINDVVYTFRFYPNDPESSSGIPAEERVNILVQTGGSREWHAADAGMEIRTDALQRWRYNYNRLPDEQETGFELLETMPLASMADPGTLTDFIRWSVREYPAKKYALVLWDHGGGAKSGLMIDELYSGDVLYLNELKQALADTGTQLEIVMIDACLMASIETAWTLMDSARWMVASEEMVPGKGTAIGDWLQLLVDYPEMDGQWLGRAVCDTTSAKYGNSDDKMAQSLLTWSLTDLSQAGRLLEAWNRLFRMIDQKVIDAPVLSNAYSHYLVSAERYGDGKQNMVDLGSMIYGHGFPMYMNNSTVTELMEALAGAVVYAVRGPGRSEARGLAVCYPADFTNDALDQYARNFPMPEYLAFLDSVTDWTAPEWIYEKVERMPDISKIDKTRITADKIVAPNGFPGLRIGLSSMMSLDKVTYRFYRLDEGAGECVMLGHTMCASDRIKGETIENPLLYLNYPADPLHWPAIEGTLCCIDMIQAANRSSQLYNIPAQIGSDISMLRCGRTITQKEDGTTANEYTVYGVWQGYEENSDLMSRSVFPLAVMSGQEYRLLYPHDSGNGYSWSMSTKVTRHLSVREVPLPPGTYYLEYELVDNFMRTARTDRIEINWDGENLTFPGLQSWEGEWIPRWNRKQ